MSLNEEFLEAVTQVYDTELNPVSSKAQRKVVLPEKVDLEVWINEELLPEEESQEYSSNVFFMDAETIQSEVDLLPKPSKRELRRMEREQKRLKKLRKKDPFYLAGQLAVVEE